MVTVFTPTYNRKNLLPRVYEALKIQTDKDFEWVIVDDGSCDGTSELIKGWQSEKYVTIKYIFQENAGKHSAFNTGVENASGKLFFCVDSDDYPVDNAVELINKAFEKNDDNSIAGLLAMKEDLSGNILGRVPQYVKKCKMYEISEKYNCKGEYSVIYKTEIIKKYPYPVIEGEKFIGESVVYDMIDISYDMFVLNKVVTICEYQEGGLTGNFVKLMVNNPTGYKIYYGQRIDLTKSWKSRIGYILRYNIFNNISKDLKYDYKGKHKFLVQLLKPIGFVGKYYYYKRLR